MPPDLSWECFACGRRFAGFEPTCECGRHATIVERQRPDDPRRDSGDRQLEELVEALRSFGVDVEPIGREAGPSFERFKVRPAAGIRVEQILRLQSDLQVQLGTKQPPAISIQGGHVAVDLPREDRELVRLTDVWRPRPRHIRLGLPVGRQTDGKTAWLDLANPDTCHLLVGGATGSGKSVWLRSMALALLDQGAELDLVDPKWLTFLDFQDAHRARLRCEPHSTADVLEEAVERMEQRYLRLATSRTSSPEEYRRRTRKRMRRRVILIDEFADLMADKQLKKRIEASVVRLGQKARQAGIHLVLATQRPDRHVVTGLLKANLPGRIALRTSSAVDSRIVLGETCGTAAQLLGKGDLLLSTPEGVVRAQGPMAEPSDLEPFLQ